MDLSAFAISRRRLRNAARQSLQTAVAAATVYLVMQWCELPEAFVGVLSGAMVVQPSISNTLLEAKDRVAATLVGSIIGTLCLFVLPAAQGPWVAAALAI